ncbi:MAG TPA: DUF5682 family protein [Verrucomicrobiota bacterium]|nr:hypothetical protein [Verrucomicrobiales bacterium]HRI13258.1 DUF5682 family protein [Verrucomicrobiota bacterium]
MTSPHVFGIRHHGPGSARSLRRALQELKPDCLLIEGPPDADDVLSFATRTDLKPPVALLLYDPEKPQRSAMYPFARFSPEWQAIQYGFARKIPVRFMDLPQSVQMGIAEAAEAKAAAASAQTAKSVPDTEEDNDDGTCGNAEPAEMANSEAHLDPLAHLARAAGYSDSERWWENMVEHRRGGGDVFAAVLEAITALREAAIPSALQPFEPEREARREAHMRQTIRAAQKEGFERIAVVCGAWHAPALAQMPSATADAELLKGLPRRKVAATWIPWTYSRLAADSGYGAGVKSPGWYDFLWEFPATSRRTPPASESPDGSGSALSATWLTRVARLLRGEDLDASSASVIEAVRLAETLAALRQRPLPGLPELNEATQTVLCFGDPLPLRLIHDKLVVSERLGEVPNDTPMVPLAQDLAREQKRLRLPPEAELRALDLDLRKPNDLDRSRLLHRLNMLGVTWGNPERQRGSQKGTFHELWRLQWKPEFAVALIEAAVWGNTIPTAADGRIRYLADAAADLEALTGLLNSTLLADRPDAAQYLMNRLQAVAAVASDVGHLMGALPPLAEILRYGNVRNTDAAMVAGVVEGLVKRICIGLPGACGSLNDEAAEQMFGSLVQTHAAIGLLQQAEHIQAWNEVLHHLMELPNLHGLIAGRAARLLHEARELDTAEAARRLSLALSIANAPAQSAAWVDGFLRDSGILLLHDDALWAVLDEWVSALSPGQFTGTLPLLRRTFSTFANPERRQLGERVARGATRRRVGTISSTEFDETRADAALPLVAAMLGLSMPDRPNSQGVTTD